MGRGVDANARFRLGAPVVCDGISLGHVGLYDAPHLPGVPPRL